MTRALTFIDLLGGACVVVDGSPTAVAAGLADTLVPALFRVWEPARYRGQIIEIDRQLVTGIVEVTA